MKKPIIGIPAHPTVIDHSQFFTHGIGDHYIASVTAAGGIPVIIPMSDNDDLLAEMTDYCDGFLIPGGIDVNPMTYHEGPHPLLQMTRLDFDLYELKFLKMIFETGKPVFGICRGLQIINVALGGTLYQDLSLHSPDTFLHVQKESGREGISHEVTIEKDSILFDIFGKDRVPVNSFHHQAAKKIGKGLRVTARADDGVVEALEGTDYPYLVCVQWHPEGFIHTPNNHMLCLFERFIQEAQKNKA